MKLISLLPQLIGFDHPTLSEVRKVISKGKVSFSALTHRSQLSDLNKNQVALGFAFNAAKVPLIPTAPTIDFPLAPLVANGRQPISTRLFIVDGWLWRLVCEAPARRFPRLSVLHYSVDDGWDPAGVPILTERDYSALTSSLHDWIRETAGERPNGDPQFELPGLPDLECLFQLYKTVQIGEWTWEAPDGNSEIIIDDNQFIVVARDDEGNYLAIRNSMDSIWELSHDEAQPINRGSDLREILSSAKPE
ncbi:hypothetical protein FEM03_09980 [Phragmitibacter flavus]|uniref:Uncharacterized protein n=1 Tax=Phragmitibacter flavus TaxID=2576071 RepID=A0A5R8KE99_9BACT|nr:hypothetical protein [Phragmitibacter flavus]TLD70638.1 hypothetical protein FEM03_09980 [Phragmitibacter flavus]